MANDEVPDGFLSRWSRRKAEVRQAPESAIKDHAQQTTKLAKSADQAGEQAPPSDNAASQKPVLSMADVQSLTKDSDFTQFMASEVAPEVKNAAMKKLFTDPHFNVMDGMDVYIDDYGQPDPLPKAMLRKMASAKFLNVFDDEEDKKIDAITPIAQTANEPQETHSDHAMGDIPTSADDKLVAQSVPASFISNTDSLAHDHTDLRLQPDPASRSEGAGSKPV